MRGNGGREGVVLMLEALPNCGQPNASMASGIPLALRRMGIGSVTVRNHMLPYPVVDPVGYSSRSGDCRHWGGSLSRCRAAHLRLPFRTRLTCGPSVGFPTKVCFSPKREPRRGLTV